MRPRKLCSSPIETVDLNFRPYTGIFWCVTWLTQAHVTNIFPPNSLEKDAVTMSIESLSSPNYCLLFGILSLITSNKEPGSNISTVLDALLLFTFLENCTRPFSTKEKVSFGSIFEIGNN